MHFFPTLFSILSPWFDAIFHFLHIFSHDGYHTFWPLFAIFFATRIKSFLPAASGLLLAFHDRYSRYSLCCLLAYFLPACFVTTVGAQLTVVEDLDSRASVYAARLIRRRADVSLGPRTRDHSIILYASKNHIMIRLFLCLKTRLHGKNQYVHPPCLPIRHEEKQRAFAASSGGPARRP